MSKNRKLSDKEFFTILRQNAGLYARTKRAIEKQFSIQYTRQAVRVRALQHPEILKDINEENIDVAEEGLYSLMRSRDERIKLRSIELYLKTKGKKRGYIERYDFVVENKDEYEGKTVEELEILLNEMRERAEG